MRATDRNVCPPHFIAQYVVTSKHNRRPIKVLGPHNLDTSPLNSIEVWDLESKQIVMLTNLAYWEFERVALLRMPPDPEEMNEQRAEWANTALSAFAVETGLTSMDGEETIMSDLIGNFMHYCDRHDMDFERVLRRGREHYLAETTER